MADSNNKGAFHITNNNSIYEPARNNTFEFLFPANLDGIVKAGVSSDSAQSDEYIKNAQEVLRVAVEASSVPGSKLGIIEIKKGNTIAKFADVPTYESGTLTIKDFVSENTGYSSPKDVLLAWKALAFDDKSEKIFRASNYKRTCGLIEYTPDWKPIRQWTLEGCWISEVSEENFSTESDGKRTFSATLVYDRAYPVRVGTVIE